jgi:hypothetical protein
MNNIEDRLRDAFTAVDRQVVVPPRHDVHRHRPSGRMLLAAAAIVAVVAGAVTVSSLVHPPSDDVGLLAEGVTPAEFNETIDPVCQGIRFNRAQPRFATLEAFRIAAEQRAEQIELLRTTILAMPPPTDAVDLPHAVVSLLDKANERVHYVMDLVELERIDALPTSWPAAEDYFDVALERLADHGASECG